MGKRVSNGSRTFNFISNLLAFVLSAVMGIAFVMLVDKTHDLFSDFTLQVGRSACRTGDPRIGD